MLLLDGKRLAYDQAFTHNGIQYPANWLRLSPLAEKQAIGIIEVAEAQPAYDQRFYWGFDEEGNKIPKDLDQLKETFIAQAKDSANKLLVQSDWYVVRRAELGTAIPVEILNERSDIRRWCGEYEAAINLCTTVEDLETYITGGEYLAWEDPAPVEEDIS